MKTLMKKQLILAVKGALMGAANVIPGVSGGTIALLTNIFEELVISIRSFDIKAVRLLLSGQFRAFAAHIHLDFLLPLGAGVLISILSFSRLLKYLLEHHSFYVWSFFFGLILASVFVVLRKIRVASVSSAGLFLAGTAAATSMAFLTPAQENTSLLYLAVCGAVAICSMILPGLSGSYVLMMMGNYQLVMIDAVVDLRVGVLLPFAVGAVIGLAAFARFLSWIFSRFHDQTIALLTGFIFGSLSILWPWKTAIVQTFVAGDQMKAKVTGYTYHAPELSAETAIALAVMIIGAVLIVLLEKSAGCRNKNSSLR